MSDSGKKGNLIMMGISEEKREKEILEETMTEIFPKLMKNTKPQFQKSQRDQPG